MIRAAVSSIRSSLSACGMRMANSSLPRRAVRFSGPADFQALADGDQHCIAGVAPQTFVDGSKPVQVE